MIGQRKNLTKNILTHLVVVCCFLVITLVYFSPQFQGKVVKQNDVHHFTGMSHELSEYYAKEGQSSVWTGSMFSGMPAYQIGVWGSNPNLLDYIEKPLKNLGAGTSGPVFTGMLMAYLLFLVLGFGALPSALGAIAFSLSSYNIVIIEAGHVTKAWAIAYMPLILAGMLVMFRKKYLLGGLLMAIGLALQIKNNHLQITYYTGLTCAFIYLGYLYKTIKDKDFKGLGIGTAVLTVAVALGAISNSANFFSNYEMAEESIRGQSELSQPSETEKQSSGLDIEYAFRWSYGKAETFTLLIPNLYGGVSAPFDEKSESYKTLITNYQNKTISEAEANGLMRFMSKYWGDQPFTQGTVYFGAIVCFLFILGMIVIKSKMKWMFLAISLFFIALSWGRHFEILNNWMFYNFPLYNKFRAVSMALVIPSLTMVIVAIWGVKEYLSGTIEKKKLHTALYWSAGVTGIFCLLLWLIPTSFLSFTKDSELQIANHYGWMLDAMIKDREALLTADALRSLIFILLAAAILWIAAGTKMAKTKANIIFTSLLVVLVLVDLWTIDKRFLNESNFVKKERPVQLFPESAADKYILQDKSPSYRVLNMTNPNDLTTAFNEATTAFHHKAVGGYHAAKLRRYQELIEHRILPEMQMIVASFQTQNIDSVIATFQATPTLNMLNTKYVILSPNQQPLENPYHFGNAWFVSGYTFVNTADDEIAALNHTNPVKTAVINKRFEQDLNGLAITPDSTASIEMTLYKPDRVVYKSNAKSEQLAIFSEIYYANGWEAYIDGKLVPHIQADWVLRAMRIPAGEHNIEFKFVPHQYYTSRTISEISSGLLILLLFGTIVYSFVGKRKGNETSVEK
ncbi:hypothetical protein D0T53_01690 [Dysgonomonas sp. 216]|uniref:YfhO family protein n=1 Tax=Dysgonomonas sp. 216 TaxID=2302934 RepID=UPI0013D02445|nr:YfhO family protein [Dysgonomonas sp. 216]NDW17627.1 hypothetical protein [Dysgonomonas sp. 216]